MQAAIDQVFEARTQVDVLRAEVFRCLRLTPNAVPSDLWPLFIAESDATEDLWYALEQQHAEDRQ